MILDKRFVQILLEQFGLKNDRGGQRTIRVIMKERFVSIRGLKMEIAWGVEQPARERYPERYPSDTQNLHGGAQDDVVPFPCEPLLATGACVALLQNSKPIDRSGEPTDTLTEEGEPINTLTEEGEHIQTKPN